MAEGVIDLKKALAPAIEALLEGDNHAVVVGHGPRGEFRDLAEPGVGTGRNRRAATQSCRKRPKAKSISGRILNQSVNAMHPGIAEAQRTVSAKGLLQLQAPSLVLRPMGLIVHDVDARWGKERVRFLDLG